MTERNRRDTLRVAEEAAEWLEELAVGGTEARVEFAAWLRRSPRHIEEFLLMKALDREAQQLDPERLLAVPPMRADLLGNVAALELDASPRRRGASVRARAASSWRWGSMAAGLLLMALGLLWLATMPGSEKRIVTGIGEQRAIELDDGSIVQLNARSRLQVSFSSARRELHLMEGEALFKVARDASRPFLVRTPSAVIQAVGTQFNVYRRGGDTTVSVIEGTVRIEPVSAAGGAMRQAASAAAAQGAALFSAGEEARIVASGALSRAPSDVAAATAWRQRRLIFKGNALAEIADEFNRYNRGVQIRIEGEALRARRYGGTFDADDPQSLVDFLRPQPGLQIREEGAEIRISARESLPQRE